MSVLSVIFHCVWFHVLKFIILKKISNRYCVLPIILVIVLFYYQILVIFSTTFIVLVLFLFSLPIFQKCLMFLCFTIFYQNCYYYCVHVFSWFKYFDVYIRFSSYTCPVMVNVYICFNTWLVIFEIAYIYVLYVFGLYLTDIYIRTLIGFFSCKMLWRSKG